MSKRTGLALVFVFVLATFLSACGNSSLKSVCKLSSVTQELPFPNILDPAVTKGGMHGNAVRTLEIDESGVWVGYTPTGGVDHFDGKVWRHCMESDRPVNALLPDGSELLIGVDGKTPGFGGLYALRQSGLMDITSQLPDYRVYTLLRHTNVVYAGTLDGIGTTSDQILITPLNSSLKSKRVHALLPVVGDKNTTWWIGHHNKGVTTFTPGQPVQWLRSKFSIDPEGEKVLAGDETRVIRRSPDGTIWIGSDGDATPDSRDGGISVFNGVTWTYHNEQNGLPNGVQDVQFDHFGRAWAATTKGTFYLDQQGVWQPFSSRSAFALRFGPDCDCPFNQDSVVIGLNGEGLEILKLPPLV